MNNPVPVAIALGSNLGDRAAHLDAALAQLSSVLDHLTASSRFETDPVGVTGEQPRFLNAAAIGTTRLPASELLDRLLDIEASRGRERPFPLAPRTLDLDLIFYGDAVIDTARLQVPHPRVRERRFVLAPLAEIAPEWRDPVTGRTVWELLSRLPPEDGPT
ncbi:MAG: 2-amino-4-hydroxy-6-hydroxymethyldihydropteridine diphosphokinase [Acidobacteriaceae bacterium]|nr:2-amino-4-hydroxy-6-hydroxymethyldihydropteridine diphosphokinase [Acidobacteriaceae bacterium]